jgi:acylphosphatase
MAHEKPAGGQVERLYVTGRVQGVGYRNFLSVEAQALGLNGWVRNRADGAVEALVAGPPTLVDALVARATQGPPRARVDSVRREVTDAEPPVGFFVAATV